MQLFRLFVMITLLWCVNRTNPVEYEVSLIYRGAVSETNRSAALPKKFTTKTGLVYWYFPQKCGGYCWYPSSSEWTIEVKELGSE